MGFDLEVEMIRLARERDLLTAPYVFDAEQAQAMAEAGADVLVPHMGLTTKGTIGAHDRDHRWTRRSSGCRRCATPPTRSTPTCSCCATAARSPSPTTSRYVLERTTGVVGLLRRLVAWSGCPPSGRSPTSCREFKRLPSDPTRPRAEEKHMHRRRRTSPPWSSTGARSSGSSPRAPSPAHLVVRRGRHQPRPGPRPPRAPRGRRGPLRHRGHRPPDRRRRARVRHHRRRRDLGAEGHHALDVQHRWKPLRLIATYTPGGEEQALRGLPDFAELPAGGTPCGSGPRARAEAVVARSWTWRGVDAVGQCGHQTADEGVAQPDRGGGGDHGVGGEAGDLAAGHVRHRPDEGTRRPLLLPAGHLFQVRSRHHVAVAVASPGEGGAPTTIARRSSASPPTASAQSGCARRGSSPRRRRAPGGPRRGPAARDRGRSRGAAAPAARPRCTTRRRRTVRGRGRPVGEGRDVEGAVLVHRDGARPAAREVAAHVGHPAGQGAGVLDGVQPGDEDDVGPSGRVAELLGDDELRFGRSLT